MGLRESPAEALLRYYAARRLRDVRLLQGAEPYVEVDLDIDSDKRFPIDFEDYLEYTIKEDGSVKVRMDKRRYWR